MCDLRADLPWECSVEGDIRMWFEGDRPRIGGTLLVLTIEFGPPGADPVVHSWVDTDGIVLQHRHNLVSISPSRDVGDDRSWRWTSVGWTPLPNRYANVNQRMDLGRLGMHAAFHLDPTTVAEVTLVDAIDGVTVALIPAGTDFRWRNAVYNDLDVGSVIAALEGCPMEWAVAHTASQLGGTR